ncbi:hypothetical protein C1645_756049 [Glomus cerebriforme]|uniref:Uncharacterized protein n=1 Tax=Glomus cerebriforme TaxID=658196 RepID=A0A397TCH9_9GLOM|nr:hypothetical protein C1645_756049 [Glomus cerebriforme]
MYLSPCPMRNSIFVSNRSNTSNNLSQTSNPSENSIYYNLNQQNNNNRNLSQLTTTSPLQTSLLSNRNQPNTNFLQRLQAPSTLQSNNSLSSSTSRFIQPTPVLDSFNTQNSINTPLNLVPSGSAINKNNYEPAHRCTTCGHVHTCDDCKHISNIQQVIDPPVKKVHEPIIINTAKAMGRMNRRMANGPYFRPERSRNVLISQDEILHRTIADPNLNFTDIVNQVAKEKEQEQEKAMFTGNFSNQNGTQNGHQNGRRQERPLMDSSSMTNYQNVRGQQQQQSNLSPNITTGFQSPQSSSSTWSSPTSTTIGFSPTMEVQPVQDRSILSSDFSSTSALLQGDLSSQSQQEQLLNSTA